MKKAILACRVLYKEILDSIEGEDFDVEFLPQGLHDLPDSNDMQEKIQEKIDFLEEKKDYDYIILGYGYCSGGVEGLKARKASLVISKVHDCIPILLGKPEAEAKVDSGRTYYLSRGWIDCGGDSYKEYLFLVDQMQGLVERFKQYEQKNKETITDWYEKDRYKYNRHYSEETAKYITFECIKNYESITLIDNDNLESIHYDYTEEMHSFIDILLKENKGKGLKCQKLKGDLNFLKDLLFFEKLDKTERDNKFFIVPPGHELKMGRFILGNF